MEANMDEDIAKKPCKGIAKKPRKGKTKKETLTFAYPTDDTGLPLPMPGMPPVPDVLLDFTRREIKQIITERELSSNEADIDRVVEWSLNPYDNAAYIFRKCLKNPPSRLLLQRLEDAIFSPS
jgi:hypothetical protein